MQGYFFYAFLNASVGIPAIVAAIRFNQISRLYLPFIFFVWIGCINEILSISLAYTIRTNAANSNVYVLIEYVLILLQFFKWNIISKRKTGLFMVVGLSVWLIDNLMINSIRDNNSIFRIFYSLVIVFFSVDRINKLIINERKNLLEHPVFLICSSFLMFYSIKAFIEVFNAFHLSSGAGFNRNIFMSFYF